VVAIASACDTKFVPHFLTMLDSAATSNRGAVFYLVDCGIEPEVRSKIEGFASSLGIALHIFSPKLDEVADLPTSATWPTAIYGRLLLPELLPESLDRVIYVDADCIVSGSVDELWETDMESMLVAGVLDPGRKKDLERDGVTLPDYINSGVLLMNLAAWRGEKVFSQIARYLRENITEVFDQDAINQVCKGRIRPLSHRWNFMTHMLPDYSLQKMPVIFHFTGPSKPWLHSDAPCKEIYLYHRARTPYPLASPTKKYRSGFRRAINLLLLRPKYWRRVFRLQQYRAELESYHLENVRRALSGTPESPA